jgi:hypothetical protein
VPNGDNLKNGILRTRDLVELYLGGRMVASIVESQPFAASPAIFPLVGLDPRRIRYEVWIANQQVNPLALNIGAKSTLELGNGQQILVLPGTTFYFSRNYQTDLDAVSLDVYAQLTTGTLIIGVRETFLNPLPVDESP